MTAYPHELSMHPLTRDCLFIKDISLTMLCMQLSGETHPGVEPEALRAIESDALYGLAKKRLTTKAVRFYDTAQLLKRFNLNLSHPLASQSDFATHFLQRTDIIPS